QTIGSPTAISMKPLSQHDHLAARWREQTGHALDQRGLARSIGADKAEDLAGLERQIDAVKRPALSVPLGHLRQFHDGPVVCLHARSSRRKKKSPRPKKTAANPVQ